MYVDNLFRELVIDNFAGGGGASVGMELAQGFPPDYIIDIEPYIGKKYSEAKQVARLGNAVCPPVAEALVRANCAEIASQRVIATMTILNAVIDESCHRKRQYRRAAHAPQNWEQ